MANNLIFEMRSSHLSDEDMQWSMEELETAIRSPPFIFQLPESVRSANPDAFLPRPIALGPHNAKNKMHFYKLYMANKVREELHLPEFDHLCTQLWTLKLRILACYDTHFEIDGDRFAKIMLVDALFLLRLLLNITAERQTSESLGLPLPKFDDQDLFNNDNKMLLNDVLKLENQIPLVVFQGILPAPVKDMLHVFLYRFCESVSPFSFGFFSPDAIVGKIDPDILNWFKPKLSNLSAILHQSHHLLHFMYFSILIFPKYFVKAVPLSAKFSLPLPFLQKWLRILGSVLDIDFIQQLNEAIGSIEELLELIGMVKKQTCAHKTTASPLIPSASQLQYFLVKFKRTDFGILYTKFIKDPGTVTQPILRRNTSRSLKFVEVQLQPKLMLPVITVNSFTETLFENLVAFEAMANISPPVFAQYLELMKALIPTSKDLKILKDQKIIYSDLDNDEEVVKLFRRMGSSISTLKKPTIKNLNYLHHSFQKEASTSELESEAKNKIVEEINEKYEEGLKGMVEEINQYYDSFWIVKIKRYVKKSVSCVVKMLAIFVIIFQIFLVAKKLVSKIIGDDEPNYYQIAAT